MVSNTVYSPTFSPFQASQYIYTSGTKQGFTIEKKKNLKGTEIGDKRFDS